MRFKNSKLIASWYEVFQVLPDLYCVDEQDHVAFFIIKNKSKALFIDSGLGLNENLAKELLKHLSIDQFDVLATHAHCDHAGLNHLANDVLINELEWTKYQRLNEVKQTECYFHLMKDSMPWPNSVFVPKQNPWSPTRFIQALEDISFGDWNLVPIFTPGHTVGHQVFFENKKNIFFLGDFAITGANYLHLQDSSLDDYITSLEHLWVLIQECPSAPLVLPCHNDIPMPAQYIHEILRTAIKIRKKQISPTQIWKADSMFVDAWIYDEGNVRIVVKKSDLA